MDTGTHALPRTLADSMVALMKQLGADGVNGDFDYVQVTLNPAVHMARFKWLEPRHMVHVNDRWQRNREDMLQHAFLNGIGFESWENVWGIWVRLTPRDGEALRRMATLQRALSAYLISPAWEPRVPTEQFGVLASRWPLGGKSLWTLVNRNEYAVSGPQLALPAAPARSRPNSPSPGST